MKAMFESEIPIFIEVGKEYSKLINIKDISCIMGDKKGSVIQIFTGLEVETHLPPGAIATLVREAVAYELREEA